MSEIGGATIEAFSLLFYGDAALWEIIAVSLSVSFAALCAAAPAAVACAYALAAGDFAGRRALMIALHSLLSFPTVVVGLILYLLLSRQGPLGGFNLLFTPAAMAIGQFIIAFPILCAFSLTALQKNDARVRETALTLGASPFAAALTELREAKFGVAAALAAGFGRVISEVGCALMVGGNIAHHTRTIPTAIALETGKGAFAEGIALGIVLMALAATASALVAVFQGRGR
jgi:tungstate transport system permease protein